MVSISGFAVGSKTVNGDSFVSLDDFPLVLDGKPIVDCENVVILDGDNIKDGPEFDIDSYLSPIQDGGGLYRHNATTKNLEFDLLIRGETQEEYEETVDGIKEILTTSNGYLEFINSGERRRIACSLVSFRQTEESKQDIKSGVYEVSMQAFGDIESKNVYGETYYSRSGNSNVFVKNGGSKLLYPDIIITFGAGSNCTDVSILYGNYTFTVSGTFLGGDTIIGYGDNPDPKKILRFYKGSNSLVTIGPYPTVGKFGENFDIQFTGTVVDTTVSFSFRKKYY